MSDDPNEVEIDLSEFDAWDGTIPPEMVEAARQLANEEFAASVDARDAAERAAREEPHDGLGQDGEVPPGFDAWNEYQREDWAAEEGIGRAEARRRLALVIASETNQSERRHESTARSGWDDVPLDGILDAIEAGTLVLPVPTVGMLTDGSSGLLYAGRVNGIAGESGAGKGWLALTIGLEQMVLGRDVYYIDFEDSPALALLRLVRVLGAAPALIRGQFHYVHPSRHDDDAIRSLVERVASTPGALVVIDSTGESIAAAGWNQNHDEDVAAWFQSLAHPLADDGGATVLLLDHLVKSEDGGLWPIGSQRKRAAITGTQLVADVIDPFSETKNGAVALKVAKDRHGAREARSVASYVQFQHPIESIIDMPDGTREIVLSKALTVELGPGRTTQQAQADKAAKAATALDLDVSSIDQLTPAPTSQRDVIKRMGWGGDRAMAALREWRNRQPGGASCAGATAATRRYWSATQ